MTTATEQTTDQKLTLSNYRVEYHTPDYSKGHVFEPYCAILADGAEFNGKEVRVFDVPDPDEGQRAVAQFACDAMNQHKRLRLALLAAIKNGPHGPACKTWNIVEWMRDKDIFDDCDCWKQAAREAVK